MSDINVVALTGRLGRDPEIRRTQAGTAVANVSLAVSKRRKEGEDTTWARLVFWDKLAEIAEQYLRKGSQIAVRGELQVREYQDKAGEKRTVSEVRVHDMNMLGKAQGEAPALKAQAAADLDDEIPF